MVTGIFPCIPEGFSFGASAAMLMNLPLALSPVNVYLGYSRYIQCMCKPPHSSHCFSLPLLAVYAVHFQVHGPVTQPVYQVSPLSCVWAISQLL